MKCAVSIPVSDLLCCVLCAVCCVLCAVPIEVLHQGLPLVRLHRAVQAEVLPSVGLRYTLGEGERERGKTSGERYQ
jgi:hypothetical protein